MGRFSTAVAAVGVDAGNLPKKLPTISLIDALLPASWTSSRKSKPLDPNVRRKTRVTYYELQDGSNGRKKLVAHKSASDVAKNEAPKAEDKPAEEAKKDDATKDEEKTDEVTWTPEQDEKLKAMKAENKSWKEIEEEIGRSKQVAQPRYKELMAAAGNDQGKKGDGGDDKKAGGSAKGQNEKGKQGGGDQGKQGKGKNKGGKDQNNNQKNDQKKNQNNNQNNNNNDNNKKQNGNNKQNENKNNKNDNNKKEGKAASNKPTNKPAEASKNNETCFTMRDWLTLQEDDIFSFGELQCLSELIGKDGDQSWQRVAAKFFDLTGRRVHPDDVREKFESMAMVAEGKT